MPVPVTLETIRETFAVAENLQCQCKKKKNIALLSELTV